MTTSRVEEVIVREPDLPAPSEGKAWRRKSDGLLIQGEMYLGELRFLNGERLEKPIQEKPEDYEEVDTD
ncbi:MAG: hypothetical protein E6767_09405 [Dysgonomonas sp.]|nr:hypothetical protein [Dysgonomonas sp.]